MDPDAIPARNRLSSTFFSNPRWGTYFNLKVGKQKLAQLYLENINFVKIYLVFFLSFFHRPGKNKGLQSDREM